MKLALNIPINSVSFGQVSSLLLRTLYEREQAGQEPHDIFLLPIGPVDLGPQNVDDKFKTWLQEKIIRGLESYQRDIPVFKLWHLRDSLQSYGKNQVLFSFYELDNPTKIELNIARNNKFYLSSNYSRDVFKMYGVDAQFLPLAFDSYNFKPLNKKYHDDGRIVFNLCGKLEKRKHHAKVIQAWIKKYGGNAKYNLQCAIYNGFLNEQQNNEIIRNILHGQRPPFNVTFLPHTKENSSYNDTLNSADIIIGMSGGEGWGLPEFQSVGIGKHAVLLKAHSYKTWATDDMVTWVNPTGKVPVYDGIFFQQGDAFNQGQIFDWNEDDFIAGCEEAIRKVEKDKVNKAGLELPKIYSKERFTDEVIATLQ